MKPHPFLCCLSERCQLTRGHEEPWYLIAVYISHLKRQLIISSFIKRESSNYLVLEELVKYQQQLDSVVEGLTAKQNLSL